jgi:IS1 family transposase
VGDRSCETLKPLYERVDAKFKPLYYATDDYVCYTAMLPEEQHATGKDLTDTTEQHREASPWGTTVIHVTGWLDSAENPK